MFTGFIGLVLPQRQHRWANASLYLAKGSRSGHVIHSAHRWGRYFGYSTQFGAHFISVLANKWTWLLLSCMCQLYMWLYSVSRGVSWVSFLGNRASVLCKRNDAGWFNSLVIQLFKQNIIDKPDQPTLDKSKKNQIVSQQKIDRMKECW